MSKTQRRLRVALAHDWLTGMRGGEAVLERICFRYPDAPLYTLFHTPGSVSAQIEQRRIVTSGLNRLAAARRNYRHLLPLFPAAVEALRVEDIDLLVSTSHSAIKGLRTPPGAEHVCYVHTPMRYIYGQFEHYFGPDRATAPVRLVMRALRPYLRAWDRRTASRPTTLLANSNYVRGRIDRRWHRDALVVHPPVATDRFEPAGRPTRDYYLMVGAFAPYKRVDLALEACRALELPLWIAGEGQEGARLQRLGGDRLRFLGHVDDTEAARLYANARALLFPGEEDFGITPVEAQASGTPVVAYGRGGALETVRGLDHRAPTGVFFERQDVDALADALRRFETHRSRFRAADLVASARRFTVARFDRAIGRVLDEAEERARRRVRS